MLNLLDSFCNFHRCRQPKHDLDLAEFPHSVGRGHTDVCCDHSH